MEIVLPRSRILVFQKYTGPSLSITLYSTMECVWYYTDTTHGYFTHLSPKGSKNRDFFYVTDFLGLHGHHLLSVYSMRRPPPPGDGYSTPFKKYGSEIHKKNPCFFTPSGINE